MDTTDLEGVVFRQTVGRGSKSERDAVKLRTPEGEYVLRRMGANPFEDPALDDLVGKRVRCTGVVHGSTFLMTNWTNAS